MPITTTTTTTTTTDGATTTTTTTTTTSEAAAPEAGFAVRYEIRAEGSVAGKGIFAVEPIPRGALLWRYSPEVVVEHDEASLRARVASLPTAEERVDLLEHVYGWEGAVHEILDDGKYWNHSTAAAQNTGNHPDGSPPGDGVSSYALRDIAPGEELLVRSLPPCPPACCRALSGLVERGKGPPARPSPNSPVCPALLSPGLLRCGQDDYSSYDELAWFEALCAEHGASSCNTVGKAYQ